MSSVVEIVTVPAENLTDLSSEVDRLAALQAEAHAIDKRLTQLRAQVREGMTRMGVDSFLSSGGHRASLFASTRWEADRALAKELLTSEHFQALFVPNSSVTLRVK